jgi:hypothetical protein
MPNNARIEKQLAAVLDPDEHVERAFVCQIKKGTKSRLGPAAASLGASTAISLTAAALGASTGVLAVAVPPAVWVVITNSRLLMFPRKGIHNTTASIGALTFAAPRPAVKADLRLGMMNTLAIKDRSDEQTLLTLRFGVRRADAKATAQACA